MARRPSGPAPAEAHHTLSAAEIPAAAVVMAAAFGEDPLWDRVFQGVPDREAKYRHFFTIPLKYCMRYGGVLSTSPKLEGVAGWVPGRISNMTFWRILRCGALGNGMSLGGTVGGRMASMRVIERDRMENTRGREFIYAAILGVDPRYQGQGHGGRLLRILIKKSVREGLPLYLETETPENVEFYRHHGFRVLKKIEFPGLGLPMWEMMREP